MKRRVRVYKAGGDTGAYLNPTAQFLQKAQMGAEQQQPDPQQILSQVVAALAPPPYGQGEDPNAMYQTLAQSYGEEVASQILNAAAGYVQQMVDEDSQGTQDDQAAQNANPSLTNQEELIRQEQERQQEALNEQYANEDEMFYDDLLFGEPEEMQEAKLGGFKKKLVKDTMKLAKKALGDTGSNNQQASADSTDILDGRQRQVADFMSSVQNNALLAKIKEQAENMAEGIMMPEPTFDQYGGFTGGDLYRFVYGGYDPSIPELTTAENGVQTDDTKVDILDNTGNVVRQGTLAEAEKAGLRHRVITPNTQSYDQLKNKGVNVGEYRSGIDYAKLPSLQQKGPVNYNYQEQPYSNPSLVNALRPWNSIFSKSYAISGTPMGMLNPADLMRQGFTMDKQRMGLGHKRYTFTPGAGQTQGKPTTPTSMQQPVSYAPGYDPNAAGPAYSGFNADATGEGIPDYLQDTSGADFPTSGGKGSFGAKLKGFFSKVFTQPERAQYGAEMDSYPLARFQGNENSSSVNNQQNNIPELKPKTPQEVWAKVEPELRKQYGLGDKPQGELIKSPESMTIDEFTNFDGENFLSAFNPAMNAVAKGIESIGSNRQEQLQRQNLTADNLYAVKDEQDRGNYDPNSGLFKPDEMGQRQFSREGGAKRRTGQQSDWGLSIFPTAMGGADIDQYMGKPAPEIQSTLNPVPREEANLEAERGETAYGDINGDGFTEHYKIGGKRHSEGGTPLNLPDDTFIFSDTRSMKISDPNILKMFGKPAKKGGYTPAELAKQYDINKYRKILEDPESDIIDRKTAEQMITKFNIKLGALALAQESKKAFPQGIPVVARPYMEMMGLKDEDIIPQDEQPQMAAASPEEMQMMQQVDETGMPPMDQMAMSQEDMSGVPMAQYGMEMGGYDMPFMYSEDYVDPFMYEYGGSLDKYQDRGEVTSKNKAYKKEELPKDASIKSPYSTDINVGDFVKQPDGTYVKVTKANFRATEVNTDTKTGTASDFYNASAENKAIMDQANAIIEREIAKGTIKKSANGKINISGNLNLPFKDQIALSRAFNSSSDFGTNKYKIASQSSTPGYSSGKGKGSFVSGFNPEIYEQRYIFEKARGQGASDDEAFAEVERVLSDPKAKARLRREYTAFLGIKDVPKDDAELLSPNFYKNRYGQVTKGLESALAKSSNRPAHGDDLWAGYEHFDALGVAPDLQYEGIPETIEETVTKEKNTPIQQQVEEQTINVPVRRDAPWWLQDQLKVAGAFGDLMSIKKYQPWAPKYIPEVPTPRYLDPTRAIGALSEQANILANATGQFSPSASLASARLSAGQGQLAKNVLDTQNRYDTQNVSIADQFAQNAANIRNQAQLYNQGVSKQLYDANTIMNQQYDNSKRALRNNLLNQYISGITNRWKTDALNQLYPQFAVDPRVGGRMYGTGVRKPFRPEKSETLDYLYSKYYDATNDKEAAQKFAMLDYKQGNSADGELYPAQAMMSLYDNWRNGGSFTFGPGMLPPMIL